MTQQEINYVLDLIDQWVAELQESRLNDQCRESGISFFEYMTQHGVNATRIEQAIIQTTGYHPSRLWTVDDAVMLRDAIFSYEAAVELHKRTDMTADQAATIFWNEEERQW